MQEMEVRSLVQEYSLEEEMTTHSSILAYKIPWRSLADCSPWGLRAHTHTQHKRSWQVSLSELLLQGGVAAWNGQEELGLWAPPGVRVAFGPLGALLVYSRLGPPCLPLS